MGDRLDVDQKSPETNLERGCPKVKIDGLPIPKGRLVKGPHKPICRDCAMYFSTHVLYS